MAEVKNADQVKRYEFTEPSSPKDHFVVFEGHEDHPFWNRDGEVAHVFTDLTFSRAKLFAERQIVGQREVVGAETYDDYLCKADATHASYSSRK